MADSDRSKQSHTHQQPQVRATTGIEFLPGPSQVPRFVAFSDTGRSVFTA